MDMVGHQNVTMNSDVVLFTVFPQFIEVYSVIPIGKEACLFIVTTLDNVKRHTS